MTKDEILVAGLPRQPVDRAGQPHGPAALDPGRCRRCWRSPTSTNGSTSWTTSSTSTTTCPAARPPPPRSRRCCWRSSREPSTDGFRRGRLRTRRLRRLQTGEAGEEGHASSTGPGRSCRTSEQVPAGTGDPLRRARPPAPAAACAAPTAACPAAAATARSRTCAIRAPSWSAPSPRIIDSKDPEEIERILADIPDIMGYAYRFGLPASLLQRSL